MRYIFIFALLLSCHAKERVSTSCQTPTDAELKTAEVDSVFCDSSFSNKYNIGTTALFRAVDTRNYKWAKEEIKRGADVNHAITPSNYTPLMRATAIHSVELVKLLLENDADPDIAFSDDGKTPPATGSTPLASAASWANDAPELYYQIVKLLLEHGADPNKPRSNNGLTGASEGSNPLLTAVDRNGGNYEIAKLLLEHGADPNKPRSDNGLTGASEGSNPLVTASEDGNYEIVKLLLEHGADPNKARSDNGKVPQADGSTPLFAAVAKGRAKVVGLLLEAGANPDVGRSGNGKSYAADGATPLMFAVGKKPNVEIAKMLLDAGANLDIKSSDGGTALDYAKRYGTEETVKLLEEYMSKEEQTKGKLRDILEVL